MKSVLTTFLKKNLYNIIIVQVKFITIETKEVVRVGYNGFLFLHSYSDEGFDAAHLSLPLTIHAKKRNPLYIPGYIKYGLLLLCQ